MTTTSHLKQHAWTYYNPVRIIAGRGCRRELVTQLSGKMLLIVTTERGRARFINDSILIHIIQNNTIVWVDSVKENPGLTDLQQEIYFLQDTQVDAILAFGGGSVMDAGKALRMGLANRGMNTLLELIEQPVLHEKEIQLPLYAIPTTAGTGSEVTPFATVWHHEVHQKLSLVGEKVFPSVAIVDAELTDALPISVTLSTGLDAINQAAESIWNKNANPLTLRFATRSLELGLHALPLLVNGEGGVNERAQMAEAGLLAGLAISHTRTALCHSISYPLTAHFNVPHGLACAFTMPAVCKLNLVADDGRLKTLAEALTGKQEAHGLYELLTNLNWQLGVAELVKAYIPNFEALLALKDEMYNPSRAGNNLAMLNDDCLAEVLKNSWANS